MNTLSPATARNPLSSVSAIRPKDSAAVTLRNAAELGGRVLLAALFLISGLGKIVGWQTRVSAFLLAGFTLLAALLFHRNFADQIQMIMFVKNVAITGGLLLLVANGAGALSLDRRF